MKKRDSSKPAGKSPDFKEALRRASALCSRQEQSSRHIRDKLNSWNVPEGEAERVISQLYKENFLDDQRYAGFYTKDKFKFNGWGKIKIAHMLRQNGIGEASIQEALTQIDDELYFQKCAEMIRKKSASIKDKNQFSRKGKLFRFASGRGFEPDLIHRILKLIEDE
jgi:regulatory protein